jgi:predicted RNase H-like nuclease
VLDRVDDAAFGVDIPIGLLDQPRRAADVAARSVLAHTASSVFPAPCRTVVDAYRAGTISDHDAANALSRRVVGAGLSRQTWHLIDKVAEADALVERGADLREVHPELAFHLRAGRRLARKRSWNGLMARFAILRQVGIVLPEHVDGGELLTPDDVLDAAIVAWTIAGLHHTDGLRSHPAEPQEWDHGRPVAIWTRP